jgi:nicotinamide-nucleotide adenylyltransferase
MHHALYLGRFQPFHLGHLNVVRKILADPNNQSLTIAIGSSQISGTQKNPLHHSVRAQVIQQALTENIKINKPIRIIALPDINKNSLFGHYLKKQTGCTKIYSGSPLVKRCVQLREKMQFTKIKREKCSISATKIRQLIAEKNSLWQTMIPLNNLYLKHLTCK